MAILDPVGLRRVDVHPPRRPGRATWGRSVGAVSLNWGDFGDENDGFVWFYSD
jgi:hypothetical protein